MLPRSSSVAIGLCIMAAAASPISAQDQGDWQVVQDRENKLILAAMSFSTGITIAVRCNDGGFETIMAGLPADTAERRALGIAFGEDEIADQMWNVAVDSTVAVSELPAPFARKLREGGRLQVRIAGGGEGGRNIRHVLELPASSAAIDQILNACDRPLVDPRDAELDAIDDTGLPKDIQWKRAPRPVYPAHAQYAKGFAVVSCVAEGDGNVRDCVVETEHPRDGGFGEATLRATRRATVTNTLDPDIPILPSRLIFRAIYQMQGSSPRPSATRIPDRGD